MRFYVPPGTDTKRIRAFSGMIRPLFHTCTFVPVGCYLVVGAGTITIEYLISNQIFIILYRAHSTNTSTLSEEMLSRRKREVYYALQFAFAFLPFFGTFTLLVCPFIIVLVFRSLPKLRAGTLLPERTPVLLALDPGLHFHPQLLRHATHTSADECQRPYGDL